MLFRPTVLLPYGRANGKNRTRVVNTIFVFNNDDDDDESAVVFRGSHRPILWARIMKTCGYFLNSCKIATGYFTILALSRKGRNARADDFVADSSCVTREYQILRVASV